MKKLNNKQKKVLFRILGGGNCAFVRWNGCDIVFNRRRLFV